MTDIPTSTSRIPGLRGLRESHAREGLKLHNLRVAEPTLPPAKADVSGGQVWWGMLGNGPDAQNPPWFPNGAGDCGFAMFEHARIAKAAISTTNGVTTYVDGFRPPHTRYTLDQYVAYGLAQGEPGPYPDEGVTNLAMLTWLYQQTKTQPGLDEIAFAEVDLTNIPTGWTKADVVHRAMVDFRGALVGVSLPDQAEGQFMRAEPWSVSPTDMPDPNNGHDVLLAAYGAEPEGAIATGLAFQLVDRADDWFVTWGSWQPATIAWESAAITDVWVILTREDAERAGYNFNAAVAEIETMLNEHA